MVRFTRRQLREALGVGDTQAKVHLARLVDLELVLPHRTDGGGWTYELAWQPGRNADAGTGQDGAHTPTTGTRSGFPPTRSGSAGPRSGPGRGEVGPVSASGRPTETGLFPLPGNTTDAEKPDPGPDSATWGPEQDGCGRVVVAPAVVSVSVGGRR